VKQLVDALIQVCGAPVWQVFPRDALELLPVHNRTSTQYYVSAERAADWSEPSGLGRI